jgi:hypothetical protein
MTLGLTEKEDGFKFSDVAPEAKSGEDISAGDSFVFSGDVSGAGNGRLADAYEGASGQVRVRVRENGQAEHNMTLLLAERG